MVWQSNGQDGDGDGVFARRFSAAGVPLATEFQINLDTALAQRSPAVAADGSGNFVVVWESLGQDGDSYGVFARRFNAPTDTPTA